MAKNDESLMEFPFKIPIPDLDKRNLRGIVEELSFIGEIAHLKCKKCQKVALKHYKSEACDHVFCDKCYLNMSKTSCPSCNKVVKEFIQEHDFERALAKAEVRCYYHSIGCPEILVLGTLLKHMETCNFNPKCLLPKKWTGKGNDPSLAQVKGDLANTNNTLLDLSQKFVKLLEENEQLKETVNQLREQTGECQKRVDNIEKSTSDIETVKYNFKENARELRETQQDIKKLRVEVVSIRTSYLDVKESALEVNGVPFIWKIDQFQDTLSRLKDSDSEAEIASTSFVVRESWPILEMKVDLFSAPPFEEVCLSLGFDKEKAQVEAAPQKPFYHRRTIMLLDQSECSNPQDVIRIAEPGFGSKEATDWMIGYQPMTLAPMSLLIGESPYVKNDSVLFKILVEPLGPLYRNLASTNGTLLWQVANYAAEKQRETSGVSKCLMSKYFSSSSRGYRMQVELYLTGWGHGAGPNAWIGLTFKRGEWDDFLPARFPHKVTYSIQDQSETLVPNHLEKTVEKETGSLKHSCVELCPLAMLDCENSPYVKNDTLLVKVVVEPIEEP